MSTRCPRSWEVEADVDGRLLPSARPSLERHEASCDDCRRERAALERLAQLSEYGADAAADDLVLRRLRMRTLEEAARVVDAKSSGFSVRWLVVSALSLLLMAGAWSLSRLPLRTTGAAQLARVTTHGAAHWTRSVRDGHERIVLQSGEITIEHGNDMASLTVVVPDGEIDDIGTVFQVLVADAHTRRIAVSQGVVVFRRQGAEPARIEARNIWYEPHAEPVKVAPPVPAAAEPAESAPAQEQATSAAKTRNPPKRQRASTAPSAPATDIMEEDVAYLRVVALLREGRKDEARLAAQRYLHAFPQGLRHKEVEAIAR
jgi:cell division septation protein DedD